MPWNNPSVIFMPLRFIKKYEIIIVQKYQEDNHLAFKNDGR